jgi:amidase
MTNGSAFLRENISQYDSELTRRYRSSGVVILGKTNTPEFGIPGTTEGRYLGICRNPWNSDYSSGGSSGGSASAVASGMVPMAHGSDGLGSIRIPAAQCGLVGMKPTQYRTPGGPDDRNRAHGLVIDHVLTRSLRDSAAMLDWTGFPEDDAPYAPPPKAKRYTEEIQTPPGNLRIGFSVENPSGTSLHSDVRQVFDETVTLLDELGHIMVEKTSFDINWGALFAAQSCVSGMIFTATMEHWKQIIGREPTENDLEPLALASFRASHKLTASQIGWGMQTLRMMSRQILAMWREFDVLLTPVAITPPPPIGFLDTVNLDPAEINRRQASIFGYTPPFNMTGQPSMSLPLGWSKDNLPIGMMFTGRYSDEATLFRLAGQLEQARPWRRKRPLIWG